MEIEGIKVSFFSIH